MPNNCPICNTELKKESAIPGTLDATFFSCMQCGDFILSRNIVDDLPYTLKTSKDASAKISHKIRLMQKKNEPVELSSMDTINEIVKLPLPLPREQADLLVRWLAENSEGPGEPVLVKPQANRAVVGAKTDGGLALILQHLKDDGFITGKIPEPGVARATLTMKGWNYYDKLRQGEITYQKAFMAMEFGQRRSR